MSVTDVITIMVVEKCCRAVVLVDITPDRSAGGVRSNNGRLRSAVKCVECGKSDGRQE